MGGIGVACALLLLSFAALELLRSRLESSQELRESLTGAVEAQLGAELVPGALSLHFLPASLVLDEAVLLFASGAQLELPVTRVLLDRGALLRAQARLEAIELSGPARLRMDPLELAGSLRAKLVSGTEEESEAEAGEGWHLDARLRLESGGTLSAAGPIDPVRGLIGDIRIEALEASPFAVLLGSDGEAAPELQGNFDGTLTLASESGPATLRLASAAALLNLSPLSLQGPVALVAELPAAGAGPSEHRFAVDASGARVEYVDGFAKGGFAKASGRDASVEGQISRRPDGRLRVEGVRLKIQNFEARGRIQP